MSDTLSIIQSWGRILEQRGDSIVIPASQLPVSKENLQKVLYETIAMYIKNNPDPAMLEALKTGYLSTADIVSDEEAAIFSRIDAYTTSEIKPEELAGFATDAEQMQLILQRVADENSELREDLQELLG